jgi:hypothetical protein
VTVVVGSNFNKIVLDSTKDVLLEIYAPWCACVCVWGGGGGGGHVGLGALVWGCGLMSASCRL